MTMNVTIKQLKAFIAVADHRSFAEACNHLNLSQPALSITIKNLEETLGGALLVRSTRTLSLTPEGQSFLPVAKRLLADWDSAFSDVSNMFLLKRGKLTIAAMPFVSAALLPTIMADYQGQFPDINITLHDIVNEAVIEAVRSGRAELGICFNPGASDDLQFSGLFRETFIAVLPIDHPLCEYPELEWQQLFDYPFLALQNPASLRQDIRNTMQAHGIPFSVYLETHQLTTIGQMVSAGLGVSAVPNSLLPQMEAMNTVCRPLVNPLVARRVGIIERRRYQLSVAARAMKTSIQNHFVNLQDGV